MEKGPDGEGGVNQIPHHSFSKIKGGRITEWGHIGYGIIYILYIIVYVCDIIMITS